MKYKILVFAPKSETYIFQTDNHKELKRCLYYVEHCRYNLRLSYHKTLKIYVVYKENKNERKKQKI